MTVPYAFSAATSAIPLSQLDANFNTTITLGNTAIQLGNTVTTLNNMTLANVTISSGNVTLTNVTVTTANVTTANITTATIGTANVTTANVATSIVTTSETLSYGTTNGVAYLNGSKVLTTGSVLTFDGTNLGLSGGNPAFIGNSSSTAFYIDNRTTGKVITFRVSNAAQADTEAMTIASASGGIGAVGIGYTSLTSVGNNGLAVLGNVGIGTSSPGTKLDVSGADGVRARVIATSGGTPGLILSSSGNTAYTIKAGNADNSLRIDQDGTDRITLASGGNLGLGVTPSAWSASWKAFQVERSAFSSISSSGTYVGYNWYNDGGNKYIATAVATLYEQESGAHRWYSAPSGTAGNAITFTQAMTLDASGNLAVGVTSTFGKFNVGDGSNGLFELNPSASGVTIETLNSARTNAANLNLYGKVFTFNNKDGGSYVESARITSGGDLVVNSSVNTAPLNANAKLSVWNTAGNANGIATGYGTANGEFRLIYLTSANGALNFDSGTNNATLSSAGAWTNASDARLKKNIVDIKYGLADVLKTQPRSYEMNDVEGEYIGFVAQELQTVIPEVVSGDPEKQLGVDYGSLVALAFKAIQELKAEVDSLKAQLKGA